VGVGGKLGINSVSDKLEAPKTMQRPYILSLYAMHAY
jgi:hypothetical protein